MKEKNSKSDTTYAYEQHTKIVRTQGVQSKNVSCQLLDKNGNLWFSIQGEGVYRYDGTGFTNFTTKDGLCSNNVGPIIQDREGNIVIGTSSGICKYDGNTFMHYAQTDTLSITRLMEDNEGQIWFGAINKGIYKYDGKLLSNTLFRYEHAYLGSKTEKYISDIIQDKAGNIWFSSWNGGGVHRFDGNTFTNFLPPKDYYISNEDGRDISNSKQEKSLDNLGFNTFSVSSGSITDDMIFSITEDKSGKLWFATRRHGVCIYDGKSFTSFKENEHFIRYGVHSILEDHNGSMWFTTDKNGVYCYDGNTMKNYTTKDGLVNNSVMSILEDKQGNLWFGTREFGLSRFDGKTFVTFSDYNEE
jgi:ligand-binding sensor domain-containing protein